MSDYAHMRDERVAPYNRVYFLNSDNTEKIGMREEQMWLFGRPYCVSSYRFKTNFYTEAA